MDCVQETSKATTLNLSLLRVRALSIWLSSRPAKREAFRFCHLSQVASGTGCDPISLADTLEQALLPLLYCHLLKLGVDVSPVISLLPILDFVPSLANVLILPRE